MRGVVIGSALGALTALSGCLPPLVEREPNRFFFTAREDLRLGNFNAAGFTPEEVRAQVAATCVGGALRSFEVDVAVPSDAVFGAACEGASLGPAGRYDVVRQPDGSISRSFEQY